MKVSQQPEINIGTIGHVDHGKTTLTRALSGEWTDRHSEELKRHSIRLGYADAAFYKCEKCDKYTSSETCPECGGKAKFLRAISLVDSPGHETLMATMLSGAAMMQGALLMIAANEACPQPQTKEHLMALSIIGVEKIIIVQNKIDIVTKEEAMENYRQIKKFIKGTIAEDSPIIPISAHHDVNIDKLIETIETYIPTPKVDPTLPPRMFVARSFDINIPGSPPKSIKGGVLGGSLTQGCLEVGDEVEILPGRRVEAGGKTTWELITTTITSLHTGNIALEKARPGGLIAIGTKLDPALTKSDGVTGRVLGKPGTLPQVLHKFNMTTYRWKESWAARRISLWRRSRPTSRSCSVLALPPRLAWSPRPEEMSQRSPQDPGMCGHRSEGAISRRISGKWRLIGYGIIQ